MPHMGDFDVIVVGAGISGIGAATRLATLRPHSSFVVLEGRDDIGGTWDKWRYPGVRSDSEMASLSLPAEPWTSPKQLVDGPEIKEYLVRVAQKHRVFERLRLGCRVQSASYSSKTCRWSLETSMGSATCKFAFFCTGYYDYKGYTPDFPGVDSFKGEVVHPIAWPEDIDYEGKKVVIVGSGATAMSMAPSLAQKADHVTVLQRTPSYLFPLDRYKSGAEATFAKHFPLVNKWKNAARTAVNYYIARRYPDYATKMLIDQTMEQMPGMDVKHFTPPYNPWDQRVCAISGGDLFKAVNEGKVSFATDIIQEIIPEGVRLQSNEVLEADIIVSATGFNMQKQFPMNDVQVSVDGEPYVGNERVIYRGAMLSDLPNFAFCLGYINAAWTLRSDLTARYVCRLLNHMERRGFAEVRPQLPRGGIGEMQQGFSLTAGYVQRSADTMPKVGTSAPWNIAGDPLSDRFHTDLASFSDGTLAFKAGVAGLSKL